jgi:hypothetical protein
MPSQEGLVQEEVAKAWNDYLREEAHGQAPDLGGPALWRGNVDFLAILLGSRRDETRNSDDLPLRFLVVGPDALRLE